MQYLAVDTCDTVAPRVVALVVAIGAGSLVAVAVIVVEVWVRFLLAAVLSVVVSLENSNLWLLHYRVNLCSGPNCTS